jgi:hypothetical protein
MQDEVAGLFFALMRLMSAISTGSRISALVPDYPPAPGVVSPPVHSTGTHLPKKQLLNTGC